MGTSNGSRLGGRRVGGKGEPGRRATGVPGRGRAPAALALCGMLVALAARPLAAQDATTGASPFLAPAHWSVEALRRLDGLGLLPPSAGWSERTLTRGGAQRLLAAAVRRAAASDPGQLRLARGFLARFEEEFGAERGAAGGATDGAADGAAGERGRGPVRVREAALSSGYEHATGRVIAGIGYDNATDWTGTRPIDDLGAAVAAIELAADLSRHLAVRVAPGWSGGGGTLRDAQVAAAWGVAGLWAGRREAAYGPGLGGGIVLGGGERFDGAGLFLVEPAVLPGPLRRLGPWHFDLFLSRIENGDRIGRPWFSGMRLSGRPHPRLTVGVSRGVIFGGEGNTGLDLRNFAYMLIGKHAGEAGEFDNQVVAVDLRYRPPLGSLPVALYLEWGFDDSAGAWKNVPGTLAGIELPAVPGLPALALRVERTAFAGSCCGNTIWYRNWSFRGGWSAEGRPLGHPLGGHGTEWLAGARADLHEARVRLEGRAYLRDRGAENLFAPERVGRSTGGALRLEGRLAPRLDLVVSGDVEAGARNWKRTGAFAGMTLRF